MELNEYQRMLQEDRDLACPKCLGIGKLASCESIRMGGVLYPEHKVYTCEACEGSGVRQIKVCYIP